MRHRLWLLPVLAALSGLPFVQAAEPAPLTYHAVQPTQAGWLSSDAKVEAVRDTLLSAQVAGAVIALHVKAGDRVRAGQELLRIDARMASQGAAAGRWRSRIAIGPNGSSSQPGTDFHSPGRDSGTQDHGERFPALPYEARWSSVPARSRMVTRKPFS